MNIFYERMGNGIVGADEHQDAGVICVDFALYRTFGLEVYKALP